MNKILILTLLITIFALPASAQITQTVTATASLLNRTTNLPATCTPYSVRGASTGVVQCNAAGNAWTVIGGVASGAIVNADIAAGAAIAWSKLATGTVSRVLATNTSGVVTTANALIFDAVNDRLGIGLSPVLGLTIYKDINGVDGANIYNVNAGTATVAQVGFNNGTANSSFRLHGNGFSTSGPLRANGFAVTNDTTGIDLSASGGSGTIGFWTAGVSRATFASTGALTLTKSLILSTAGETVSIKTGSNACSGSATLSSGTVTVSTTCTGTTWGTDFIIHLTPRGSSVGINRVSTHTAATSFVITSSDVTSTDQIGWTIQKLN